ncbi:MAG TPA: response regulator transcription factor [Burkholderiales bacterium]
MSVRVVIVEDQRIVRELLSAMLAGQPDTAVVGQASTGAEALELVDRLQPDVVLLDIGLPDIDGIAVMQSLRSRHPAMRVIALSIHDEPRYVEGMIDAGASGYVLKSATVDELRQAIRAVAQGETYLSPELRHPAPAAKAVRARRAVSALGRRERQVLSLLAEGRHSAEIAAQLGISVATVDVHRRNIMRKLDLHTIAELTKFAVRKGLTSL